MNLVGIWFCVCAYYSGIRNQPAGNFGLLTVNINLLIWYCEC